MESKHKNLNNLPITKDLTSKPKSILKGKKKSKTSN